MAELVARDRAYAEEIAVFRKAVEDIAATPQGAAALARFNAGDEIGALAVLNELRAARDKARQKRADIESAAEGRRIATLALGARTRGKQGTADVLARFEEVVQLDSGMPWDWVELGRLYQDAGRLADAERAARAAAKTAVNDRDRMLAFGELDNVLTARGNGPAALAAYRQSKSIAKACARRDRTNLGWQRDLSLSHEKIGNMLAPQGDGAGALAAYRKDLSIADALRRKGDGPGALVAYRKSHAIFEALAGRDPTNHDWQHGLIVSYVKFDEATSDTLSMVTIKSHRWPGTHSCVLPS